MIDVDHQISAVDRVVGERVLEAGTARVVTASQVYDATVEELWDACTSPERIPRWFLPISGDLTVGGRYQSKGTRAAPSSAAIRHGRSPPAGSTAPR